MSKAKFQFISNIFSFPIVAQQLTKALINKLVSRNQSDCSVYDLIKIVTIVFTRSLGERKKSMPHLLQVKLKTFQSSKKQPLATSNKSLFIQVGGLHINKISRRVDFVGRELFLTAAEFEILQQLATDAGNILSRDHIAQNTTEITYDELEPSFDIIIRTLRKKLNDSTQYSQSIKTIASKGYLLVPSAFEVPS